MCEETWLKNFIFLNACFYIYQLNILVDIDHYSYFIFSESLLTTETKNWGA